jgi:hypothetical protein
MSHGTWRLKLGLASTVKNTLESENDVRYEMGK